MPAHEERVLETLRTLAHTLQHGVSYQQSAPTLSHYRELPESVIQSYDVLSQGAQLIHATATKYTLVGKIDVEKTYPLQDQLVQGCELVATGCVAVCADITGCSRSTRRHARQAARNIVQSVISLIESDASAANSKTGVVWETCDFVSKLPKGNRNAMRRDLLTYKMECQETLQEFQQVIDKGPCNDATVRETDDDLWQDFMSDDQYNETEFAVALPSLALFKCTRGSLNIAIDAMETIGKDTESLNFIADLFERAALVGEGLTDFGACLYSPFDYSSVKDEAKRQVAAVRNLLEFVQNLIRDGPVQFSTETVSLVSKVSVALEKREQEILEAISVALG